MLSGYNLFATLFPTVWNAVLSMFVAATCVGARWCAITLIHKWFANWHWNSFVNQFHDLMWEKCEIALPLSIF